ncbi:MULTISPECIES: hypothetical protein [Salinibaculum]|uniref:hypothetical protein n=1 Tax=Salinibaculum TaxID=2732368 RepID=UPI0030D471DD
MPKDRPLDRFTTERQEELFGYLWSDDEFTAETTVPEVYQIALVLYGTRPGCNIGLSRYATARDAAEISASTPPSYWDDALYPFLDNFDIPYVHNTTAVEAENGIIQLNTNYYISYDSERRDRLRDHFETSSRWGVTERETHVAIGRFLGYPERVIQEWCDMRVGGERLFETLTDEEILNALDLPGTLTEYYNVDPSGFIKYLLPYVIPVSAAPCQDRVFRDARDFLRDGFRLSVEYDVPLLSLLFATYRIWNGESVETISADLGLSG